MPIRPPLVAGALFLLAAAVQAQTRTISLAEAAKWENLGASVLSADGQWLAYGISRGSGENELRFRKVSEDSTRVARSADQPAFSRDGRWLAYRIGYTEAERTKAQKTNQTLRDKLGLIELNSGKRSTVDEVQGFSLNYAGTHLAYRKYAPAGRKSRGADLILRDLATGVETGFGNIAEFAWQERGPLLALVIDGEGMTGNGVQLYDAASGSLRTLDSEPTRYAGIVWRRKADDLAVMRARPDSMFADTAQAVVAWRGLTNAQPSKHTFATTGDANTRVVPFRRLRWADDGSTIFLGVKTREPKLLAKASRDSASAEEKPEIDVWHARDVRVQPFQKMRLTQDRERNDLAAWHIATGNLVKLTDERFEGATLAEGQKRAVAVDDKPYEFDGMFGRPYRDLYLIDVATGKRDKVAVKIPFGGAVSPAGRFALYFNGGHWWSRDLQSGATVNLTKDIKSTFANTDDDHPVHERGPWGGGLWTAGDRSVILYDKFDLWEVRPDGSTPRRLTRGAEEKVVHRYVSLDPELVTIDLNKPIYLSLYGDWSKESGFARLTPKGVERLVFENKSFGRLTKAENADVFAYTIQSYTDSPDLFVGGPDLNDAKQVTATNPFQGDYAWGKAELIEFTNARGEKTQAILNYPANYQPGRTYPMVVYIYERLTNGLHGYTAPSERAQYNVTNFSQHGYFVLRPDITYVPREPGKSTIDAVVPAIEKVVSMGLADRAKVGVMGHSWGGYGTAFLATHTQGVFAAANAGAALTNLVSFYGYTSENSGLPEAGHFEVGQERMETSPWEDPQAYIRNSPIFTVKEMTTPLLIEHGDKDGNVDFGQGIELYNAARRMGKNVVMIVYNGENHGLAKKPNQMDYARKQLEWFGHYLKGEPAPRWITEGIPAIERVTAK